MLNLKEGDIVVDATLGGGGHSREILKRIGEKGILIGIDQDESAISSFAEFQNLKFKIPNSFQIPIYKFQNIILVNGNFSDIGKILEELEIEKVDAILADLGWSSDQLSGKGMSFMKDEELDMRLDRNQELTAKKIVNEYGEEKLKEIIKNYSEERFAKNIARKICKYRKSKVIETTTELAEIIKNAIPERFRNTKINPATKTFQALRIEVNQELENLKKFVPQAIEALDAKGRLAIISFHSLEDRIVKNIFRENAGGCIHPSASLREALRTSPPEKMELIYGFQGRPKIKIISKKPIIANEKEVENNPRARSAKLRVCEKVL